MDDGPSGSFIGKLKALLGFSNLDRAAHKFEEEIQELIDEGAEKGVITSSEGEMIQSIFEFGDIVVREVMVPRTDVIAISEQATFSEVIDLALGHGHSRLPVYQEDIDHIVGILHVKNLLSLIGVLKDQPLPKGITRHPYFIPESKKVRDLLPEFQAKKTHMAIVLDEYGGTAGLITLEDIIEKIVGEIQDEYDSEDQKIIQLSQDTILVDARLRLEELGEFLNVELPEGQYESVGGFIIDLTGKVPEKDERVHYKDLIMTIRQADERKISQVEIKQVKDEPDENSRNT